MTERAYATTELVEIFDRMRRHLGPGTTVSLVLTRWQTHGGEEMGGQPNIQIDIPGRPTAHYRADTIEEAIRLAWDGIRSTIKPSDAYAIIGLVA